YIDTPIIINKIRPAMIVEKVQAHSVLDIRKIAQEAIIGARINICKPITKNTWICVISFVERVIRLALENPLISSTDKDKTLLKSNALKLAAKLAKMFAIRIATNTERIKLPKAAKSIKLPTDKIRLRSLPGV